MLRAGRQRHRRGDRDDAGADRGRAAKLGHRRRRLPASTSDARRRGRHHRRARERAGRRDARMVPDRRRQAAAGHATRSPGGTQRRRAGQYRADGAGAPRARQAALGGAVPARDRLARDGFVVTAAAARRALGAPRRPRALDGGRAARCSTTRRRQAAAGRHARRAIPRWRPSSSGSPTQGPDSFYGGPNAPGDRRARSAASPRNPARDDRGDLAAYDAKERAAGLRHLSRLSHLRHGPAVVGRDHGVRDPRAARALRPRALGHEIADHLAPVRRSEAARLCRPRALSRRPRFRRACRSPG